MSPIFTTAPRQQFPLGVLAEPLLSGERGTAQTIARMRELVDQALRDPHIVHLAMDIVGRAPQFDDPAEAQAIYEWVRSNIRFTKDPVNKEKLYPPAELLKTRAGDCDDISMLLATLMMAVGYPTRLITVSANAGAPEQFTHVYVEAEVPPNSGMWIAMDAARPDSQFAFGPPMYYRKRAWSLTDDSFQDLSGSASRPAHLYGGRGNVATTLNLGDYPRFRSLQGLGTGLGAYQAVPPFAWLGWRRRIPGGPEGGQYHGFTHNYSAGTRLSAQDRYEADRDAGMASHDAAHANPRSPRGVYRGPAEVPPAPNAGTRGYRVFRGYQTQRHPGTSESPGSFPAPFVEQALGDYRDADVYVYERNPLFWGGPQTGRIPTDGSGATSVVAEPGAPEPWSPEPSPRIIEWSTPPIFPQPAPRVSVKDFIPDWQVIFGDGKVSGRVGTAPSDFADWMEQDTILPGTKNKYLLLGGALLFVLARSRA